MDKHQALKKYFGYDTFRGGQEPLIDALLAGKDALGVLPTGAGKSVCYQLPAILFGGVTVVVSPLISLMKDQVNTLCQLGVSAAYINSSLSYPLYLRVCQKLRQGDIKLIYVAPERLLTPDFLQICEEIQIDMVAVDEAHCVSQWGQDFRPSYLQISQFLRSLPHRPVVGAFTATATAQVKEDIAALLDLQDPFCLCTGFDRPNLHFAVQKPKNKISTLMAFVKENADKSGIVYCSTRKAVENVCDVLQNAGIAATRYHAGLDDMVRKQNQEDFVNDTCPVMVATNAFGMGIDKSNVAYVVHYNLPKNIESYYQEAGRAGRDGQSAHCLLLYSPADVATNRFLIENSELSEEIDPQDQQKIRQKEYERLKYMTLYATTTDCLRAFILNYFGQKAAEYCGSCSNCQNGFESRDVTIEAQKVLSCVYRCAQRFGAGMIVDVLRGSQNARLLQMGLQNQSTYGIMAQQSATFIHSVIDHLVATDFLAISDGKYPTLRLTKNSAALLRGQQTLCIKTPIKVAHQSFLGGQVSVDNTLLNKLKDLRKALAAKARVPAYVVFTDATLVDMCAKLPKNTEEFGAVSGVGHTKSQKYGSAFLELIAAHERQDNHRS